MRRLASRGHRRGRSVHGRVLERLDPGGGGGGVQSSKERARATLTLELCAEATRQGPAHVVGGGEVVCRFRAPAEVPKRAESYDDQDAR